MNILVINSGSSSIKFQLLVIESQTCLAKGLIERIGLSDGIITYEPHNSEKIKLELPVRDHVFGLEKALELLTGPTGVIKEITEIDAVGHRIVHGGDRISESIIIDDKAEKIIKELFILAPLHNPANLMGVKALKSLLPANVKHVGVFDTAFHATIPQQAYTYALPYQIYQKHGIRRYGFHGASHQYVAQRAADMLKANPADVNLITVHLGNGCSLAAIKNGKSVDTSLGYGTMCGVPMGTRAGDVDPAVILHLIDELGYSSRDIHKMIYKESGLLGLSGVSSDCRDIEREMHAGNPKAKLALDVFGHQVARTICALASNFDRLDAIVFTAGIGENHIYNRNQICNRLKVLGVEFNEADNNFRAEERIFSAPQSKVKLMVIPTNEELMIALETRRLTAQ